MKKVLISRYGAYGDIIHASPLPHIFKDKGFDVVDFETNFKGLQLLKYNPYIDNVLFFDPTNIVAQDPMVMLQRHWEDVAEGYDLFVNLFNSLERGCIALETDPKYYMDTDTRKAFKEVNYYDQSIAWAGFPEEIGKYQGELYFTKEEEHIVERYIERFKENFLVLMNFSGTGIHKRLIYAHEIIDHILSKYPEAQIITSGDSSCKELDKKRDRVINIMGRFPFRQAALLAKHVNCYVGPESGLSVAANSWNTPTIQLMTGASLINHCLYAKNDYSLQSPAYCSPCAKGPYDYIGCPSKNGYPLCVFFDLQTILNQVDKLYDETYRNRQHLNKQNRISQETSAELSVL